MKSAVKLQHFLNLCQELGLVVRLCGDHTDIIAGQAKLAIYYADYRAFHESLCPALEKKFAGQSTSLCAPENDGPYPTDLILKIGADSLLIKLVHDPVLRPASGNKPTLNPDAKPFSVPGLINPSAPAFQPAASRPVTTGLNVGAKPFTPGEGVIVIGPATDSDSESDEGKKLDPEAAPFFPPQKPFEFNVSAPAFQLAPAELAPTLSPAAAAPPPALIPAVAALFTQSVPASAPSRSPFNFEEFVARVEASASTTVVTQQVLGLGLSRLAASPNRGLSVEGLFQQVQAEAEAARRETARRETARLEAQRRAQALAESSSLLLKVAVRRPLPAPVLPSIAEGVESAFDPSRPLRILRRPVPGAEGSSLFSARRPLSLPPGFAPELPVELKSFLVMLGLPDALLRVVPNLNRFRLYVPAIFLQDLQFIDLLEKRFEEVILVKSFFPDQEANFRPENILLRAIRVGAFLVECEPRPARRPLEHFTIEPIYAHHDGSIGFSHASAAQDFAQRRLVLVDSNAQITPLLLLKIRAYELQGYAMSSELVAKVSKACSHWACLGGKKDLKAELGEQFSLFARELDQLFALALAKHKSKEGFEEFCESLPPIMLEFLTQARQNAVLRLHPRPCYMFPCP